MQTSSRTAIIHIGLPKTGSTSLQAFLDDHRLGLRDQGIDFFKSKEFRSKSNHIQLYLSCLRPGVETFSTLKYPNIDQSDLRHRTSEAIRDFFSDSKCNRLLFSTEGLSFLRTSEECIALKELFPPDTAFEIILVLRDKADWLKSYTGQIHKDARREPSSDPRSALYVEGDTWLTHFEDIISAYEAVFGAVRTIDYDKNLILPKVLEAMGIDAPGDWDQYRLNTSKDKTLTRRVYSALRRLYPRPS